VGSSAAIEHVRGLVRRVAATPDTTVLIRGESGTGKGLIAEAVHWESERRHRPFVGLNCSSLPPALIEAELFGHERGAFTDAKAVRRGLAEESHGGTLFLDEIGDLPLELQPKLLALLESRTFRRIGGNRETSVDIRIVAATHRDLEAMVRERTFRADLLFRLKVFEIVSPPLRERGDDIEALVHHFLGEMCRHFGRPAASISPAALGILHTHAWPGNVRELRNALERAMVLADGNTLRATDLPVDLVNPKPSAECRGSCPAHPAGLGSFPTAAEIERRYVRCVYRAAGGNKTRAAEILGISRLTLREKLKQMDQAADGEAPAEDD
jgi:DNA-binding NtrC family response regulator